MASFSEEEVALEAAGDLRTPTGTMSWVAFRVTLREKFKAMMVNHNWPESDLVQLPSGVFAVPSIEYMFSGYVFAHQQLYAGALNLD